MKNRIVAYSIWIAWGCMPAVMIWSDDIPLGAHTIFWIWYAYMLFALWFTIHRCRIRPVKPRAPHPDGNSE
jgi:hypothetical protein